MDTFKSTINNLTFANNTLYCITGTDRNGRRFKAIYTTNPQHYDIYSGTLWYVNRKTGKRRKILTYYNNRQVFN